MCSYRYAMLHIVMTLEHLLLRCWCCPPTTTLLMLSTNPYVVAALYYCWPCHDQHCIRSETPSQMLHLLLALPLLTLHCNSATERMNWKYPQIFEQVFRVHLDAKKLIIASLYDVALMHYAGVSLHRVPLLYCNSALRCSDVSAAKYYICHSTLLCTDWKLLQLANADHGQS